MEQRTEIRDGQVFTVTVIPEEKRRVKKAVVTTKSERFRQARKKRGKMYRSALRREEKREYATFAEGFAAAAKAEQERLDRHSAIAKTL